MYGNIFEIWRKNKEKVPFAVRKTSWSDPSIYVIVVKVIPDNNGYGKAYGYPTTNGAPNEYFEYDNKWRKDKQIPVAGCYVWEEVENVEIREDECQQVMNLKKVHKEAEYKPTKKSSIKVKGMYELETVVTFGKYKGKTIAEVLEVDPGYLKWAVTTIDGFVLDKAVDEAIKIIDN